MTFLRPIGILLLVAGEPVSAPQGVSLPVEARKALDRAVELTGEAFRIGAEEPSVVRRRKRGEAAARFAGAVGTLATPLPAKACGQARGTEGKDLESKLMAIACDKRDRPALHAEIERVYIKGVHSRESRFPRSPEVRAVHATEKYRLAWEFFLLSPEPEGASPLYQFRVGDALDRIRNSVSIVSLRYSCQAAAQRGVDADTAEDRQRLALRTLNVFANEAALRAMLVCLGHIREQAVSARDRWDAEGYVYRLLSDQENYGNGPQWRRVVTSFPEQGLPPEQRKLLEDARRALQKFPAR